GPGPHGGRDGWPVLMTTPISLVDALSQIDLADTTRGGVRARVEEAAALIHQHIENTVTGHHSEPEKTENHELHTRNDRQRDLARHHCMARKPMAVPGRVRGHANAGLAPLRPRAGLHVL